MLHWIKCYWKSLSAGDKIALVTLGLAIVSAVPFAVKLMRALWKWILEKRDARVEKFFRDWDEAARLKSQGSYSLAPEFQESDIALQVGRRSVSKSLARLAAAGRIRMTRNGGWESKKNGETQERMGREYKRGR
jgi:hypothetical protein